MVIIRMAALSKYEHEYDAACEFCGSIIEKRHGCTGNYFADQLLPNYVCTSCGKSSLHEEEEKGKTVVHGGSNEEPG